MKPLVLAVLLTPLSLLAAPPRDASRVLSARNLGLAELEEARNKDARKTFERLSELTPNEPLPWANAAIAALRDGDLASAERLLGRARQAGGERADLYAIGAALEEARNRPDAARAALAKAAALAPRDLESRWRLVRLVDAAPPAPELAAARRKALVEIVAAAPSSLPARLRLLVLDLESASPDAARELAETQKLLEDADGKIRQALAEAGALREKGDARAASLKARIAENLLRVTQRYQQSLGELFTNVVGLPLTSFSPALEAELRPGGGAAIPIALVPGTGAAEDPAVTLRRVDLANTGKAELYSVPAPHRDVVFLDHDLDGDLDVYLLGNGPDKLLRNNLDGTFADVTASIGEHGFSSRRAIPVDVDRDGDLDLVCVEAAPTAAGALVLRANLRQGRFRTTPLGVPGAVDVAAEDLNADGFPDLVAATASGVVVLLGKGDGTFTREPNADLAALGASKTVLLADLDNDGLPDLVVSTATLTAFRRSPGGFTPWPILPKAVAPAERLLAVDADRDGDLDVVAWAGGKGTLLVNGGGNANGWLDVTLEGLATGSGKVNRGGVGSLVEVKAGDLYVGRTVGVVAPLHFGLGTRGTADVVRTMFTNGIPQNAFSQRARTAFKEVQKLKGSCPFVYAFDGGRGIWSFVSDALGRAPLGLLYDGVHLAGADTREWLLVDGDRLRPTPDGKLLLDYTEELWEVAFLDEATLMAVDHPIGTRVVPNERTIPGVLEKKLFTVARPRALRGAWSERGGRTIDVLDRLARRDAVYVDPGPETTYQGFREEHGLVLDLGPVAAGDRVVLFLDGWIFYTDTSINVSMSQRGDVHPLAPVLEVPDGAGGWRVAMESFGFPAGKTKTMPVDLTGLLDPVDPRVRIRTTMAIRWDEAFVTVNDPAVHVVTTDLAPASATLSERGFPRRHRETPEGPEVFDHDDVSTAPAWEDVPGRVTRLGDVTELLRRTDDRWVAFKGGDAIRIAYDASRLPPLAAGFRRDYVLVSDGWDKDFDRNTITGQSVEPWPFHAMSSYPYPASERHPDPRFLEETLTRATGPETFRRSLGAR